MDTRYRLTEDQKTVGELEIRTLLATAIWALSQVDDRDLQNKSTILSTFGKRWFENFERDEHDARGSYDWRSRFVPEDGFFSGSARPVLVPQNQRPRDEDGTILQAAWRFVAKAGARLFVMMHPAGSELDYWGGKLFSVRDYYDEIEPAKLDVERSVQATENRRLDQPIRTHRSMSPGEGTGTRPWPRYDLSEFQKLAAQREGVTLLSTAIYVLEVICGTPRHVDAAGDLEIIGQSISPDFATRVRDISDDESCRSRWDVERGLFSRSARPTRTAEAQMPSNLRDHHPFNVACRFVAQAEARLSILSDMNTARKLREAAIDMFTPGYYIPEFDSAMQGVENSLGSTRGMAR